LDNTIGFTGLDTSNLPASIESEQAVLGSVLVEPSCFSTVHMLLKPEHFYLLQHRAIFSAMIEIDTLSQNIDAILVLERIKRDNVFDDAGGKNYLFQLTNNVLSIANVEHHAKTVREKYYLRRLIEISQNTISNALAQEESADIILDSAEQQIYDVRHGKSIDGPARLNDILANQVLDRLAKLNSAERDEYLGLETGFADLDNVLIGLNKSDLVMIGARPGMGKTSFALNIAKNIAGSGKKRVLFFSLEMTKEQIAQRVLCSTAAINNKNLREGNLSPEDWKNLASTTMALNDCDLYFDDSSNISVSEMKAKTRRLGNVDCVIVDYLGLIKPGKRAENRVQEVSEITRSLKLMAKDLNLPVIVCTQLSRSSVQSGKSRRPQLADMRDSGSIEQDADVVLLLYRKSYISDEENDEEIVQEEESDDIEVIVAKNRHGETRTVTFVWDAANTRFLAKTDKY